MLKNHLRLLTSIIFLLPPAFAYAGISISESPSYDGDYRIIIGADVWSPFSPYSVSQATLEEKVLLPGANDWSHLGIYDVPPNSTSYAIWGRTPGSYEYVLRVCGQTAPDNGGCIIHEIQGEVYPSPSTEPTGRLDLNDFDLYYGDFNNDGIDGDIYFHERDLFVLIAGDVSIPLLLERRIGFVIYRSELPVGYRSPQELRLSKEALAEYQKLRLDYDYFRGDINGDGDTDFFIRGAEAGLPSVQALQTETGYPVFLIPKIDINSHFDPSDRRNLIRLQDYNLDGRADLVMLSSLEGYVLDVIYAKSDGKLDESYFTVSSLDQIFSFNTYSANATGTLAGEFRVSESGAATYSIPVLTPEGTAGVTPSVGISYSSQAGNGIMGKGWSLNAFSSISRCRQTLDQDKNARPVAWTSQDRFCLNGQRLLLVGGSAYGAADSTYRTEIDSQILVTLHGNVSGEPDYFSALKKDGTITYYGLTSGIGAGTNSKQTYGAGKTMSWYQSVVLDNVGNPIKHFYKQLSGKDFRLDRIEYAYGATGAAATSANTILRFTYEKRPDIISGFIAGHAYSQQWRLKRIDVDNRVNSTKTIRTYHIFYNREMVGNAATKRSLVGAIQECAGNSCKKATRFDWDLVNGEIDNTVDDSLQISTDSRPLMDFNRADFNGDGVQDLVWLHRYWDQDFIGGSTDSPLQYAISVNGKLELAEFAEGGTVITYPESGQDFEQIHVEPIDYNADGRSDLAVYRTRGANANTWVIYLSVPTVINGKTDWRLTKSAIPTGVMGNFSFGKRAKFADIDGDGLTDIMDGKQLYKLKPRFDQPSETQYRSNNFYRFVQGSVGWSNIGSKSDPYYWLRPGDVDAYDHGYISLNYSDGEVERINELLLDFNGDGLMDLVGTEIRYSRLNGYPYNKYISFALAQTPTGGFSAVSTLPVNKDFTALDANADGLADIIYKVSGKLYLLLSNGKDFEEPRLVATIAEDSTFQVMDFNLDGYVDIMEFRHQSDYTQYLVKAHLWNNDTQLYDKTQYAGASIKGNASGMFMDVDGDGLTDFVRYQDKKLDTFLFTSNYQKFEAVSGIASGLGAYTDITYEPLNATEHYSGLDVNPEVIGASEYCVPVSPRLKHCEDYSLYSADDFYYALNKGINSSISKLKTNVPVLEMNGPFQIVTRVTNKVASSNYGNDPGTLNGNGGGGSITTNTLASVSYYYNEAKIQAGGRGFLGFHQLTTKDEQTGIKTATIYRQDFPFIGSPLSTYVYAPDDTGLLSEAHNVYALHGWPSNAQAMAQSSGTAALGPIKPFVRESVEVSYQTESSVESGGAVDLLHGNNVNIGGCVDTGPGCHPYLNQTTNQLIAKKVVTLSQIDAYGNALSNVVETTGDGLTQRVETVNEYGTSSDSVNLHGTILSYAELGRLTKTTVTKSRNEVAEPSQYSSFEYYESSSDFAGMLRKEVAYPDGADNENLETLYLYDHLGLVRQKNVTGWDGNTVIARTSKTFYDTTGRFVHYSEDSLGHKLDEVLSRNEYGAPKIIKGVNGKQVTKNYDAWGREVQTSSNTGGSVSTSYVFCPYSGLDCPSYAKTAVIQRSSAANNAITAVTFQDSMGREIRSGSLSFDGRMVYVDTEYDVVGRVVRKSLPYFDSQLQTSHGWTRHYYDVLGRPLMLYLADSSVSKFEYSGYQTVSINDLGQEKTETYNGLGELVAVEDALDGKVTYTYTTDGQLRTTTAHTDVTSTYVYGVIPGLCQQPTSNLQTVLCYDALGRKRQMWDPDKGHWKYEYNAFGELIKQTDANGAYVKTEYDILGRPVKRWDYKLGGVLEGYTSWHYDHLDDQGYEISNATLQNTAVAYSEGREHSYPNADDPALIDPADLADYVDRTLFDGYGRVLATERKMPDGNIYRNDVIYDSEGRVFKELNVLNGILDFGTTGIKSGVQNHYNSQGFKDYVVNLEDGKKIYEATAFDEKGNLKTVKLGDNKVSISNTYAPFTGLLRTRDITTSTSMQQMSYGWDSIGNLKARTLHNSTLTGTNTLFEDFCYDSLNRVIKSFKTVSTVGSTPSNVTCPTSESGYDVTYDLLGNIERKTGVGTYAYGEIRNGHRAGPHALTSINGSATKYGYDNNGNLLNDGARSFVYSTYDKPFSITSGSHVTRFKYGPSRNRFYREDTKADGSKEKTWYLGNIEKIALANGSIKWRRMLEGGVMHTYTTNAAYEVTALEKYYILQDHLGSSSLILKEQGGSVVVAQNMSFDVWGQRRNPQNMQSLSSSALINFDHSLTTRGYTGHEMLDEVGVIHMNGRIYDARLGRFLQADPHIQEPTDLQSYNRYAYVRNNPLNATDPSGYFWQYAFAGVVSGFMAQKLGEMTNTPWISGVGSVLACGSMGAGAIACAGGAGFGVTYGATGDFGQALQSGLIAAGSAWAFSRIGEHFKGVSNGHMANAEYLYARAGINITGVYNKFGGLYLTGAEVAQQIAAHAALGGVIAKLQGDKFAHGFVSAGVTKGVMGSIGMASGNKYSRTFVASMVGGTVSSISGGKFANGAVTAAVGQLFNQEGVAQKGLVRDIFDRSMNTTAGVSITIDAPFRLMDKASSLLGFEEKGVPDTGLSLSLLIQPLTHPEGFDIGLVITRRAIGGFGLMAKGSLGIEMNTGSIQSQAGSGWAGNIFMGEAGATWRFNDSGMITGGGFDFGLGLEAAVARETSSTFTLRTGYTSSGCSTVVCN